MKRLLALVLLLALATPVLATSLNFQNPTDYTQLEFTNIVGTGWYSWSESGTAGNNYVSVGADGTYHYTVFHLKSPYPTTYAAATLIGTDEWIYNDGYITLLDSAKNEMYSYSITSTTNTGRFEVKISGGIPRVYKNGVLLDAGSSLAQNPSYIGFGTGTRGNSGSKYWDDYVYGQAETLQIAGLPESDDDVFIIKHDMINNATDGVCFGSNGTQVEADYMYGRWSRGSLSVPPSTLDNETIQLRNYFTGEVIATNYTGAGYSGSLAWNVRQTIILAGKPNGVYGLYWPTYNEWSNLITYKSAGASVAWDRSTYSVGNTGAITYTVSGGYWDSQYTYKVDVLDAYGDFKQNISITSSSGSVTQSWTDSYDPGVYYAWLIATASDGTEYILGADYTTLTELIAYRFKVVDAETTLPIQNALMNVTQDSITSNGTTDEDGYFATTAVFVTGTVVNASTTKTGYQSDLWNNTPLKSPETNITIPLISSTPVTTGLTVGGIDRSSAESYRQPISGATCYIVNTTHAENWTATTNSVGFYNKTNLGGEYLYDIWCTALGYSNSQVYQKWVVASS